MSLVGTDWISRAQALSVRVGNFIEGRFQTGRGGNTLEKFGPRDGRLLYSFSAGNQMDVDEAVASSKRAFDDGRWSGIPLQRRRDILCKVASLLEEHRDELALLECLDVGKPIRDTLNYDVPTAASIIRFNAEAIDKVHSKVYASSYSNLSYETRRPLGVAAGIVGWNFPVQLAAQKIGPALAAGNTLILKPSELTCLSSARLAELAVEAGVPEGVLNVVHGDRGVGAALAHHRDVSLLSFTGSTATGKNLLVAAGQSNMKRLILECGGKAPNIVFDDCGDFDAIAESVVASAFWNQGQVCVASSRLLVQEGVKDEVLQAVIRKMAAVCPGDPLNSDTRFGALVSRDHKEKVLRYIEEGKNDGARLVFQSSSRPPFDGGYYVPSTIFSEVRPERRIAQEEIFGPVLAVMSFRKEDEAIAIANKTIYGLSAIVWTRDLARAHRVSQSLDTGLVVVNATAKPAGGPNETLLAVGGHKESGVGVEGGMEGLEAYLSKTAVQLFV
jgi:acyl-CoA reductase-like NAD-dependent aldehyde dehydrogenase